MKALLHGVIKVGIQIFEGEGKEKKNVPFELMWPVCVGSVPV